LPVFPAFLARILAHDDRGATAVEYALLLTLVAVVIAGTLALLGTHISDLFTSMINAFG